MARARRSLLRATGRLLRARDGRRPAHGRGLEGSRARVAPREASTKTLAAVEEREKEDGPSPGAVPSGPADGCCGPGRARSRSMAGAFGKNMDRRHVVWTRHFRVRACEDGIARCPAALSSGPGTAGRVPIRKARSDLFVGDQLLDLAGGLGGHRLASTHFQVATGRTADVAVRRKKGREDGPGPAPRTPGPRMAAVAARGQKAAQGPGLEDIRIRDLDSTCPRGRA